MNLLKRIELLETLGKYLTDAGEQLQAAKQSAFEKNKWFTIEFINLSLENIASKFLNKSKLEDWVRHYHLDDNIEPKNIGIVMAGNIPLVGFHDFLCAFVVGHKQTIKLSEKDNVLMKHIADKLAEWDEEVKDFIRFADLLKNCDAYIATGSNNSLRYFKYYFGKYPSVIRGNKTSVAILSGSETDEELILFADDVHVYFGLGCRNVTKLYVPQHYNFVRLLTVFKKYEYFKDHTKYRNNYDYNLALLIMNNVVYMANENIILAENENIFSPVSNLYYNFYNDKTALINDLKKNENIQCIVGDGETGFGKAQQPGLFDYADGIDVMEFLLSL
ncbi:MAG: acyl-CoA reductase [Bacteroidota bacterium]|nr:acyl-CoA reductase [Bacteroidota bacterium]